MTRNGVDLLVVGGGVFGLWTAKRAVEAGLSVALVERQGIGAGASGGLLGALTAHAPDRWNAKKQFQFDALLELSDLVAALEAETGLNAGYARVGRLTPVRNAEYRRQLEARANEAVVNWRAAETGLVYAPRADGAFNGWLSADAAPEGYLLDALAARIDPRAYLAALAAWLRQRASVIEGVAWRGWENGARLSDGRRLDAGAVTLAGGVEGLGEIERLTGSDVGGASGGRAALLRPPPGRVAGGEPLLYDGGVYVVAHGPDRVAVGGIGAEGQGEGQDNGDGEGVGEGLSLDDALARAEALCPALAGAELGEVWSGWRPRPWRRDPMLGRLPGAAPLWAINGGYKIGFGVAHRLARALVDHIIGASEPLAIPEAFDLKSHLA